MKSEKKMNKKTTPPKFQFQWTRAIKTFRSSDRTAAEISCNLSIKLGIIQLQRT